MKTVLRVIIAAFAASFALISCNKDNIAENVDLESANKGRIIAVSFSSTNTKSTLGTDGLSPSFAVDDLIKVSNGNASEECAVSIDDSGVATIATTLTGDLAAVYPAAAAKMNGNAIDGIIVPATQSGKFADANICQSFIAVDATSAIFENQTAIFKLSVPEKIDEKGVDYVAKSVAVKSRGDKEIADGSMEIKVGDGTSTVTDNDGFCYVSVLPGEVSDNITVCAGAGARSLTTSTIISINNIYSVALPILNGHEYVELTWWEGFKTKTLKWATMNVGATKPEEYGDYFMWGTTVKAYSGMHYSSYGPEFIIVDTNPFGDIMKNPWHPNSGFFDDNMPFTDGVYTTSSKSVYTKYVTQDKAEEYGKDGFYDDKTVLDLEDDTANVNWGGSWRMPTIEELEALCKMVDSDWEDDGMIFGQPPATIFLPFAGIGILTELKQSGRVAGYRSSSSYHHYEIGRIPGQSPYLSIQRNVFPSTAITNNSVGMSVRPVSE